VPKFHLSLDRVRDSNGNTMLNIAAANGYTDIVKILLDNGADPNIPNVSFPYSHHNSLTYRKMAMCLYIMLRHLDLIRS
jgi:ankyrin repeat protein